QQLHGDGRALRARAGRQADRTDRASDRVDSRRLPLLQRQCIRLAALARGGVQHLQGRVRRRLSGADHGGADHAPACLRPPSADYTARAADHLHEVEAGRLVRDARADRERGEGIEGEPLTRSREGRPARTMAMAAGRSVVPLALALAIAACGRDRSPAPPIDVVLVTIDTLRADRVGVYGHRAAATPVLDRLAARGARFADAVAVAPLTLPSHASIMTATSPLVHGVRDNAGFTVPTSLPTLAAAFAAAGYQTGAFVSGFPLHRRFGLARGFTTYDDQFNTGGDRAARPPVERRASDTVAAAGNWIDS